MGSLLSCSYHLQHATVDTLAAQRFRYAERALFRHFGLWKNLTEHHLELSHNKHLKGVSSARVWKFDTGRPQGGGVAPVVFLHGGGSTPGDFAPLLPYFTQATGHGRTIYLVERPGNGLSKPFDYSTCHLPSFSSHFLSEVLEALNLEKAHLVGNSMGGAFIMWFAMGNDNNKRNRDKIASISLLGVPAGFQGMVTPFYFYVLNSWMGTVGSYLAGLLWWLVPLALLCIIFRVPYDALSAVYLNNFWRAMGLCHNSLSFQSLMDQLRLASCTNLGWKWEDAKAIQDSHKIPVLLVEGMSGDPYISREQSQQVTKYIGSKHHLHMGRGHMPWFADPAGVAHSLEEFWSSK